jgi:hypothetical protein
MKKKMYFTFLPAAGVAFALVYTLAASRGSVAVSLAAAAFQPMSHTYLYTNDGNNVFNDSDSLEQFVAPVVLPDGARVIKMTFYWYDTSLGNARADLIRGSWDSQTYTTLATCSSSGADGWGSCEDTTIYEPVIDGGEGYYLSVQLPTGETVLDGVIIEYTYATSLPLIFRSGK